jgi:hypothetical protein
MFNSKFKAKFYGSLINMVQDYSSRIMYKSKVRYSLCLKKISKYGVEA